MREQGRSRGTVDRYEEETRRGEEPRRSSHEFERDREDFRRRESDRPDEAYGRDYEGRERGRSDYGGGQSRRFERGGEERGPFAGRGPRNFRRSDDRILEEVCDRLTRDPWLDATDIDVEVRNLEVYLRGAVEDREAKRRAEDIAEDVIGVEDVHNEIRVHGRYGGDRRMAEQRTGAGMAMTEDRGTSSATRYATVVGVFNDLAPAEGLLEDLRRAGFDRDQLSIVGKDRGVRTGGTTGAEGKAAGAGAVLGGIAGGALGWLLGIGALTIPGIGPVVAAGALATTLGGAAAGAVAGGLLGALVGLGIPEQEARGYEARVREGGVLLVVTANSYEQEENAEEILRRGGAAEVRSYKGRGREEVLRERARSEDGEPIGQRETVSR
jgi:hypothetical protein